MTWIAFLVVAVGLLLALLFAGLRVFAAFLVLNLVGVLLVAAKLNCHR